MSTSDFKYFNFLFDLLGGSLLFFFKPHGDQKAPPTTPAFLSFSSVGCWPKELLKGILALMQERDSNNCFQSSARFSIFPTKLIGSWQVGEKGAKYSWDGDSTPNPHQILQWINIDPRRKSGLEEEFPLRMEYFQSLSEFTRGSDPLKLGEFDQNMGGMEL